MEQYEVTRYMKIFNLLSVLLIVQKKDSIRYIIDSTRKIQVYMQVAKDTAKISGSKA